MASDASDRWLCYLARLGYAARGAVYLLVGGLAALAAFAGRGEASGERDALSHLAGTAWGVALLAVIGAGLFAFALWRLVQGYYDVDGHGRDAKGAAVRVGMTISAVANAILGAWVFTALLSSGGGGDDSEGGGRHAWTAWALAKPGGRWLVAAVGATIVGVGVATIVKGYRAKFERFLTLDYRRWPWARPLCQFGLMARGIVFGIIGWFFLQAAWRYEPGRAGGVGQVFDELRAQQPWGWLLLGLVALGLVAFGIYSFVEAAYRRIATPDRIASAPG